MATKHPLLRPAIALALGIVFASQFPVDWRIGFVGAGAWLGLFLWRRKSPWTLLGFWLFFGASLMSWRYDAGSSNDLRQVFGTEPELVTIRGALSADPEHRVLEQDRRTRYRTTARVNCAEVERHGVWQPTAGEVAISTTGFVADDFVTGTQVEISGVIAPPHGPIAQGLFDFETYLKWQRIFFVLRADSTNDWKLIRQPTGWNTAAVYRKFNAWARPTLQRGIPEDENTRLLWAMVLGWKPGLTYEISEPFMRTGTLHIFAISGLHITLIAGMLVIALRFLRLPRNWAGGIAIPLIWFYTGATGWQASAIRSTIMSSVIIVGWMLKRPNHLLNSLAASAILILLWQPEQLFQPGFQLSFILLLSLAIWPGLSAPPWPHVNYHLGHSELEEFARKPKASLWTKILAKLFEVLTGRDPMLPEDLRPKWRQRLDPLVTRVLSGVNISLASLVGSLPVVAYFFNMISFSSLFANLVIVPASSLALGSSMASLALSPFPYLPEIANWFSWEMMRFMVWFCRELESVRWTYEHVETPGPVQIAAYYFLLLSILLNWGRLRIVATAVAILALGARLWTEATTTSITLLPGSGVVFVDAPWSKNDLLIDCGRDREAANLIKPFLKSRGVDRVPTILLTHGDVAHVEGYRRLAEEFLTRVTCTSRARSRSPKYRQILKDLEHSPARWRPVAAGDDIAGWRVLHPAPEDDFARADDEVVVLTKQIEGESIMLLSELGRMGQQKLLDSGCPLQTDIAVAGVPNDGQVLRPELTRAMQAKMILLAGNDAKAQRGFRELRARGVSVRATADQGAITIRAQRGRVTVSSGAGP
jgi:competence protein ComEC